MMGLRSIFIVFLSILLIGCSVQKNNEEQDSPIAIQMNNQSSPKIVLLIIDSLMDEPLKKAIEENKAPALEFFLNHGRYHKNLVSSYPTMSVTIDSSLITGTYPINIKSLALYGMTKMNSVLLITEMVFSK